MKLLILGATGKTGAHVVEQALAQGHEVTVLVRNAAKLSNQAALNIIVGDARSEADVAKALKGQSAVISTISTMKAGDELFIRSSEALIAASRKTAVKRVVLMSSFLLAPNYKPNLAMKAVGGLMKKTLDEKVSGEELLASSTLDWTIVRATALDKVKAGGKVRIVQGEETVGLGNGIARADVASFLLQAVSSKELVRKTVLITVK